MGRKVEQPIEQIKEAGTAHERLVTTHPAFGMIAASRVSGGVYLFGSDIQHQRYMTIKISRAEIHRHLSDDWTHTSDLTPIIEVSMSEAQWQAFVSSPNTTSAPCTLSYENGEMVPSLPRPKSRGKQFRNEAEQAAEEAFERIDDLIAKIDQLSVSNIRKKDLMQRAESVKASLVSSMPFILDQFQEHMEEQVQVAKAEINAHATRVLGENTLPPVELEGPSYLRRIGRTRK